MKLHQETKAVASTSSRGCELWIDLAMLANATRAGLRSAFKDKCAAHRQLCACVRKLQCACVVAMCVRVRAAVRMRAR
eukprot:5573499-Pleurochrysis_carterae.AAC.1